MISRWPLRWKIAFYSAVMAVVATLAGAGTTWCVMRSNELHVFDARLALDVQEFFRDLDQFDGGWKPNATSLPLKFIPLALRDRILEVRGKNGESLYRSPRLARPIDDDGIAKFHTRRVGDLKVRMATFRHRDLTVFVAADLHEVNQIGWDIVWGMFAAIPTVLVVIVLGGRWVARQAVAPVEAIRRAAAQITLQNRERRLPVPPSADEIAGLIAVLNATFDRLQRSYEQSIRFSADASHQLKTPIAVLRAGIEEILTDHLSSPENQARAAALLHQTRQLTSVAENLLLLARADAGRLGLRSDPFDLREVLEGLLDDARTIAEPAGLTVDAELPADLWALGDPASAGIILQNLLDNAVKYNQPGGTIRIRAQSPDGVAVVHICNSGPAIKADRQSHVFERFYRADGDENRSGHGLGLSIARELAVAQGGDLILARSQDNWTEFRLQFTACVAPSLEPASAG